MLDDQEKVPNIEKPNILSVMSPQSYLDDGFEMTVDDFVSKPGLRNG